MLNTQPMGRIEGEAGMAGDRAVSLRRYAQQARAQEALSTSDFGFFADLVDRGTMVGYMDAAVPTTFDKIGYRRDMKELSNPKRPSPKEYRINAARIIPQVAELAEYLRSDTSEESFGFTTYKYGTSWGLSWEAWMNDQRDLGLMQDYPQSWGLSARYTQEYEFTQLYAANATFFTAARGNYAEGAGTALSADALAAGLIALRGLPDPAGNVSPYIGDITLVVPAALEFTAKNIVNSPQVTGGSTKVLINNPMYNAVQSVVVNPFLDVIDTVSGATAWYLFCNPRLRPALRYGYLSGYESPEIFVKEGDARRLGGGTSDPFEGSMDNDSIEFKCRFTFGANLVDYRGGLMRKGAA